LIATKLAPFIAHVWEVRNSKLKQNSSKERRDTAETVLGSPSKVTSMIYRSQPVKLFVAHALKVKNVKFQENLSNGNRYIAEKVLCSPGKVSLITDH
jgi:hypothetical protein